MRQGYSPNRFANSRSGRAGGGGGGGGGGGSSDEDFGADMRSSGRTNNNNSNYNGYNNQQAASSPNARYSPRRSYSPGGNNYGGGDGTASYVPALPRVSASPPPAMGRGGSTFDLSTPSQRQQNQQGQHGYGNTNGRSFTPSRSLALSSSPNHAGGGGNVPPPGASAAVAAAGGGAVTSSSAKGPAVVYNYGAYSRTCCDTVSLVLFALLWLLAIAASIIAVAAGGYWLWHVVNTNDGAFRDCDAMLYSSAIPVSIAGFFILFLLATCLVACCCCGRSGRRGYGVVTSEAHPSDDEDGGGDANGGGGVPMTVMAGGGGYSPRGGDQEDFSDAEGGGGGRGSQQSPNRRRGQSPGGGGFTDLRSQSVLANERAGLTPSRSRYDAAGLGGGGGGVLMASPSSKGKGGGGDGGLSGSRYRGAPPASPNSKARSRAARSALAIADDGHDDNDVHHHSISVVDGGFYNNAEQQQRQQAKGRRALQKQRAAEGKAAAEAHAAMNKEGSYGVAVLCGPRTGCFAAFCTVLFLHIIPFLILAVSVALSIFVLFFGETARSVPSLGKDFYSVAGVDGTVTITRDANGLPHVTASSRADAAFGQGFVHAQDRLWQVEFQRLIARGSLSEFVGEAALQLDSQVRTLNFPLRAKRMCAALMNEDDDDVGEGSGGSTASQRASDRKVMRRYVDGLNYYLASNSERPPEFYFMTNKGLLTVHEPAPFTVDDVCGAAVLLMWQLGSNVPAEMERFNVFWRSGRSYDEVNELFNDFSAASELLPTTPGQNNTNLGVLGFENFTILSAEQLNISAVDAVAAATAESESFAIERSLYDGALSRLRAVYNPNAAAVRRTYADMAGFVPSSPSPSVPPSSSSSLFSSASFEASDEDSDTNDGEVRFSPQQRLREALLAESDARDAAIVDAGDDFSSCSQSSSSSSSASTSAASFTGFVGDVPPAVASLFMPNKPLSLFSLNLRHASNAWVGRRFPSNETATTMPIGASDPHLLITAPSAWYWAHLSFAAPQHHSNSSTNNSTNDTNNIIIFNTAGVGLPGLPGVHIGQTDYVAWGITMSMTDLSDLFLVTPDPLRPATHYLVGGGQGGGNLPTEGGGIGGGGGGPYTSLPFTFREEFVTVSGSIFGVESSYTEAFTVVETIYGPIMNLLPGVANLPQYTGLIPPSASSSSSAFPLMIALKSRVTSDYDGYSNNGTIVITDVEAQGQGGGNGTGGGVPHVHGGGGGGGGVAVEETAASQQKTGDTTSAAGLLCLSSPYLATSAVALRDNCLSKIQGVGFSITVSDARGAMVYAMTGAHPRRAKGHSGRFPTLGNGAFDYIVETTFVAAKTETLWVPPVLGGGVNGSVVVISEETVVASDSIPYALLPTLVIPGGGAGANGTNSSISNSNSTNDEFPPFFSLSSLARANGALFIAAANQKIYPAGYPYALGYDFVFPYRAKRLAELFSSDDEMGMDADMSNKERLSSLEFHRLVQTDVRSNIAEDWLAGIFGLGAAEEEDGGGNSTSNSSDASGSSSRREVAGRFFSALNASSEEEEANAYPEVAAFRRAVLASPAGSALLSYFLGSWGGAETSNGGDGEVTPSPSPTPAPTTVAPTVMPTAAPTTAMATTTAATSAMTSTATSSSASSSSASSSTSSPPTTTAATTTSAPVGSSTTEASTTTSSSSSSSSSDSTTSAVTTTAETTTIVATTTAVPTTVLPTLPPFPPTNATEEDGGVETNATTNATTTVEETNATHVATFTTATEAITNTTSEETAAVTTIASTPPDVTTTTTNVTEDEEAANSVLPSPTTTAAAGANSTDGVTTTTPTVEEEATNATTAATTNATEVAELTEEGATEGADAARRRGYMYAAAAADDAGANPSNPADGRPSVNSRTAFAAAVGAKAPALFWLWLRGLMAVPDDAVRSVWDSFAPRGKSVASEAWGTANVESGPGANGGGESENSYYWNPQYLEYPRRLLLQPTPLMTAQCRYVGGGKAAMAWEKKRSEAAAGAEGEEEAITTTTTANPTSTTSETGTTTSDGTTMASNVSETSSLSTHTTNSSEAANVTDTTTTTASTTPTAVVPTPPPPTTTTTPTTTAPTAPHPSNPHYVVSGCGELAAQLFIAVAERFVAVPLPPTPTPTPAPTASTPTTLPPTTLPAETTTAQTPPTTVATTSESVSTAATSVTTTFTTAAPTTTTSSPEETTTAFANETEAPPSASSTTESTTQQAPTTSSVSPPPTTVTTTTATMTTTGTTSTTAEPTTATTEEAPTPTSTSDSATTVTSTSASPTATTTAADEGTTTSATVTTTAVETTAGTTTTDAPTTTTPATTETEEASSSTTTATTVLTSDGTTITTTTGETTSAEATATTATTAETTTASTAEEQTSTSASTPAEETAAPSPAPTDAEGEVAASRAMAAAAVAFSPLTSSDDDLLLQQQTVLQWRSGSESLAWGGRYGRLTAAHAMFEGTALECAYARTVRKSGDISAVDVSDFKLDGDMRSKQASSMRQLYVWEEGGSESDNTNGSGKQQQQKTLLLSFPGGASGNPFSKFYQNLLAKYAADSYIAAGIGTGADDAFPRYSRQRLFGL